MSPGATLVMALVVIILLGAWLAAVFRAAGGPASERARLDREGTARATEQEADPRSAHAASAGNAGPLPGRAAQPTADAGKPGPPPFAAARPGEPAGTNWPGESAGRP
jgi:hypothetical protein